MDDFTYIHKLEAQNKWREAEKEWNKTAYGRANHAPACKLLADAIEAGDRFREEDKTTVYTIIESIKGHFGYLKGKQEIRLGERLIGRVYGVSEATEAVVSLKENKYELERVVTGIKMDFPELN